jgi:hypothetical protein
MRPGPTGDFPRGKLNPDDEGGLAVAVAYDPAKDVVRVDFGKGIKWIAFPPADAKRFADMILKAAALKGAK